MHENNITSEHGTLTYNFKSVWICLTLKLGALIDIVNAGFFVLPPIDQGSQQRKEMANCHLQNAFQIVSSSVDDLQRGFLSVTNEKDFERFARVVAFSCKT